jgi:hypothetical protein
MVWAKTENSCSVDFEFRYKISIVFSASHTNSPTIMVIRLSFLSSTACWIRQIELIKCTAAHLKGIIVKSAEAG